MDGFLQNLEEIGGQFLSILWQAVQTVGGAFAYAFHWIGANPTTISDIYCQLVRFLMPILALCILASVILAMVRVKNPQETWGYLNSEELGKFPIHNWESIIGRGKHCDVRVKFATISRSHCALIREGQDNWNLFNLTGDGMLLCNDEVVRDSTPVEAGDTLNLGGIHFRFEPISQEEFSAQEARRLEQNMSAPPWGALTLLTCFQVLTALRLILTLPEHAGIITLCFSVLCAVMWGYTALNVVGQKYSFEIEILAFFACTLGLAITASSAPGSLVKQTAAVLLGMMLFLILGWYLRDLRRTVKTRYFMAGAAMALLTSSLILGAVLHGAQNWISIAGVSLQPSELAKVCFIFAGAAGLERLFSKRNIYGFMLLSLYCLGALALMSDFGTAMIFFVTFMVIAFLRSGDFTTLLLICCGSLAAAFMALKFKPYIATRFASWGHAWENASTTGFQQVRTMSAAASGGLVGVGAGDGWLKGVFAANTDLVFGMVCEEWGLIIGLLAIFSIVAFALFTVRVAKNGRSSYYVIAACAASSLLVFQTILNVGGALDLLPMTGVTFPFVSCGGSSMICCWGLLAFLKAADTRQNASFAVGKVQLDHGSPPEIPQVSDQTRVYHDGTVAMPVPEEEVAGALGTAEALEDFGQEHSPDYIENTSEMLRGLARSDDEEVTSFDDLPGFGGLGGGGRRSRGHAEKKADTMEGRNQQEIDDFLQQFDMIRPASDQEEGEDR